jgi:hypothetical protein
MESLDNLPMEFTKVIRDFVADLKTTFPEYVVFIKKWWKDEDSFLHIENELERQMAFEKTEYDSLRMLYAHCKTKFPPRIFDILYQNADIFKEDSEIDTEFLPKLHFKNLWQYNLSDKTRETIWKYLQLILFSVVGKLDSKDSFGDAAKMFEAINQGEFQSKLQETITQMQSLFDKSAEDASGGEYEMPDPQKMNDHISGMFDGKIGNLAREIAEETAESLNMTDCSDMKDVFQGLMKNPSKLMGLIQKVGDKLDSKLKSGELKESEMIEEASEIMSKMKGMPGMENIQSMLSKMGMGGMGGKVNMGAMEAQLNQRLKLAKTKERIRAKSMAKKEAAMSASNAAPVDTSKAISEEELIKLFSSSEKMEKTPRGAKPVNIPVLDIGMTEKSGKKKKGKK